MKLAAVFAVVSALFAIAASVLWFMSARIKTPEQFSIHVARPHGSMGQPLGGDPLAGTYVGHAYSQELVILATALRRQSRFSAWAAASAGLSVLAQVGALIASSCQ